MRGLEINKQTVYYALYSAKVAATDTAGYKTGEYTISYGNPVSISMNVSPAVGNASVEMFGTDLTGYTKIAVTNDVSCPIDENSVLWVGTTPGTQESPNPYNHTVIRVSKSKNSISYALKEVDVS